MGRNPVKIRCCQYLNNVVEQDRRRVKGRLQPMLGFKTFYDARHVIIGIELAQEDSQTPVLNSNHLTVESRRDLASCHGSIVRIAATHSWSYRSGNLICTRTGTRPRSPEELGRMLEGFLTHEQRRTITVIVVDVSTPAGRVDPENTGEP